MGGGGQGTSSGAQPMGAGAQAIGGSNKGRGNPALQSMPEGGMSTWQDYGNVLQAQQQQQQQQQQIANIFQQGFQKAGALVGQQQPYMQAGKIGQSGAAPGGYTVAPPQANPAGQLFQGGGGGSAIQAPPQGSGYMGAPAAAGGGMGVMDGGGGIDPQQLAMILRQLGYVR